jgi:ketosteroid isomerase-like protein
MTQRRDRGAFWAIIGMALVLTATSPTISAKPRAIGLPSDLAHALEAYNQATIHNDTATLSRLVTDDYVLVNSDASVQDKPSYLADFAVPGFRVEPYAIDEPVYKLGGASALTGGLINLGWTQGGSHHTRRLRIAHFWVKNGGKWRIAYTQLTRVPE